MDCQWIVESVKDSQMEWRLIGNWWSESSSVETLRQVPIVHLFPVTLRDGHRLASDWNWIDIGLALDWLRVPVSELVKVWYWIGMIFVNAWFCIGLAVSVVSDSSSVETFQSVPYSKLVPRLDASWSPVSTVRFTKDWRYIGVWFLKIDGLVKDYQIGMMDWHGITYAWRIGTGFSVLV